MGSLIRNDTMVTMDPDLLKCGSSNVFCHMAAGARRCVRACKQGCPQHPCRGGRSHTTNLPPPGLAPCPRGANQSRMYQDKRPGEIHSTKRNEKKRKEQNITEDKNSTIVFWLSLSLSLSRDVHVARTVYSSTTVALAWVWDGVRRNSNMNPARYRLSCFFPSPLLFL